MALPQNGKLTISSLAGVFSNVTATYKFYWFVALLDNVVKERKTRIPFWEIIAGMLAESWYPIHYFRLSFGKSDSLYVQSVALQKELGIPVDADKDKVRQMILDSIGDSRVRSLLKVFTLHVPYRFLSPWIRYTTDREVVARSQQLENGCLYALRGETVEVNPEWVDYLSEHYLILRDFAYWNLTEFLQKRNPNVPDLPSKLIKPIQRDSLIRQHRFWDLYMETAGNMNCIYTGRTLSPKQYDLDHFVPWSFVSHNLIWNLLPADPGINSSKSNSLPPLEKYLKPFARKQQDALKTLYSRNPDNTIFEDYLMVYDSVPDLAALSEEDFYRVYRKTFSPMVQIAENMGFKYWKQ